MIKGAPANIAFFHLDSAIAATGADGVAKVAADKGIKLSPSEAKALAAEGGSKQGIDVAKFNPQLTDDAGEKAVVALLGKDGYIKVGLPGQDPMYVIPQSAFMGGILKKSLERDTGITYATVMAHSEEGLPARFESDAGRRQSRAVVKSR